MAGTSNSLMGCFREFGTLPQSAYMYTLGSLSLCVCCVLPIQPRRRFLIKERVPNMLFSIYALLVRDRDGVMGWEPYRLLYSSPLGESKDNAPKSPNGRNKSLPVVDIII